MITQSISNHPVHGFKAKATLASINIPCLPFMGEEVVLTLSVDYYNDADVRIDIIPPNIVHLRATKDTMVDETGTIVPTDDPSAIMSEYDFFISLMDKPIKISDLVIGKIIWSDDKGLLHA